MSHLSRRILDRRVESIGLFLAILVYLLHSPWIFADEITTGPALTAEIVQPSEGATVSNVFQDGSTKVAIIGTVTGRNLKYWNLDYARDCTTPSCESGNWHPLSVRMTKPITNGTLAVCDTDLPFAPAPSAGNGSYVLRLRAYDNAGHVMECRRHVVIAHFAAKQNPVPPRNMPEFNAYAGQKVTYTSRIPFPLTETIQIFADSEGTMLVKTLVNAEFRNPSTRPSGEWTDEWDGTLADNATLAPDGPYFYKMTLTAGQSKMVWDLSHDPVSNNEDPEIVWVQTLDSWDPSKGKPLTFHYRLSTPGRVRIIWTQGTKMDAPPFQACHITDSCKPVPPAYRPQMCLVDGEYYDSQPHLFQLSGVGPDGLSRDDMNCLLIVNHRDAPPDWPGETFGGFPKNAVMLYGTKPEIGGIDPAWGVTGLLLEPAAFNPTMSIQTVRFRVNTIVGGSTSIAMRFTSQTCIKDPSITDKSSCILRTLRETATCARNTSCFSDARLEWDGRSDAGDRLAPGAYTVTVTATDSIGNTVNSVAQTTIYY